VRSRRLLQAAIALLVLGALLHTLAFWHLHAMKPTPALTELPVALSLMAWIGAVFYLLLLLRVKGAGLAALVAPAAFLGAFTASLQLPGGSPAVQQHPLWSHLHVLLASGGFALLGVAGAAGVLYVAHDREIKGKRRSAVRSTLPALETLDRVNGLALAVGYLLLSLGMVTGIVWVYASEARLWPGTWHANATLVAWIVYAAVLYARFGANQGSRRSALQSAVGFGVLLVAVLGVGLLS